MLGAFRGKKFHVIVDSADRNPNSEQARFGAQFKQVLTLAGWTPAPLPLPVWSNATNRGILIGYRVDNQGSIDTFKAVTTALMAFDIQTLPDPIRDLDPETFIFLITHFPQSRNAW